MKNKTQALQMDSQHRYWVGDQQLQSVTTIISRCVGKKDIDPWYMDRGTAVHAAIHLELQKKLDWESVDQRIHGRIHAALAFLKDQKQEVVWMEKKFWSQRYKFAGTLDMMLDGPPTIVDWKGSLHASVEPQIGGYALLCQEQDGPFPTKAVAVQTNDDGTYKCQWYVGLKLRAASQLFLSMLSVSRWIQLHNEIKDL